MAEGTRGGTEAGEEGWEGRWGQIGSNEFVHMQGIFGPTSQGWCFSGITCCMTLRQMAANETSKQT